MPLQHALRFRAITLWITIVLAGSTLLPSCGGLDPNDLPPVSTISGTVTFTGTWPDSNVNQVLVVALESKPTSPDSILPAVLSGRAIFSEALPTYTAATPYSFEVPAPPRTFQYVVVAMQNGPNILTDWLMLSVYAPSGDPNLPGTVTISRGESVTINFAVDFANLPPQPFD